LISPLAFVKPLRSNAWDVLIRSDCGALFSRRCTTDDEARIRREGHQARRTEDPLKRTGTANWWRPRKWLGRYSSTALSTYASVSATSTTVNAHAHASIPAPNFEVGLGSGQT